MKICIIYFKLIQNVYEKFVWLWLFLYKKYVWPLRWRNFLLMAIGIMVFKYIMFFL